MRDSVEDGTTAAVHAFSGGVGQGSGHAGLIFGLAFVVGLVFSSALVVGIAGGPSLCAVGSWGACRDRWRGIRRGGGRRAG